MGSSIQSEGIVHFNYCRSRYGCQAYVIPVWHRVDTSFILYFFEMSVWNLCKEGREISVWLPNQT